MADVIMVNRAPVLTLWGVVVAERLGFDHDEALSLGKCLAGLNAQTKGRSLGIYGPPKGMKKRAAKKPGLGEEFRVETLRQTTAGGADQRWRPRFGQRQTDRAGKHATISGYEIRRRPRASPPGHVTARALNQREGTERAGVLALREVPPGNPSRHGRLGRQREAGFALNSLVRALITVLLCGMAALDFSSCARSSSFLNSRLSHVSRAMVSRSSARRSRSSASFCVSRSILHSAFSSRRRSTFVSPVALMPPSFQQSPLKAAS